MSDVAHDKHKTPAVLRGKLLGHSKLPVAEISNYVETYWRGDLLGKATLRGDTGATVELYRYGVLSHVLERTPVVLYDKPEIVEFCSTAFTDGRQIFVNAEFAAQLIREELGSTQGRISYGGVKPGMFLLMHEAGHTAFGHTSGRLNDPTVDPRTMNYIFDVVLNPRLVKSYPLIKPGSLSEIGVGFSGDPRLDDLTEEKALLMFKSDPDAFKKMAGSDARPGQGGMPGGAGDGGGQGESGGSSSPGDPSEADRHAITPRDLARILEEMGVDSSELERLGLPKSGDVEGHEKLANAVRQQVTNAIEAHQRAKAAALAAGISGERIPGAHIDDAIAEYVDLTLRPRLSWKFALRKALTVPGNQMGLTADVPCEIRYVDSSIMGMNSSPYIPGIAPSMKNTPSYLAFVDTSGSMSNEQMSEMFSEIFNIACSAAQYQPEITMYSADTAIRSHPIKITPLTARRLKDDTESAKAYGRGGTSYANVLLEAYTLHRDDIKKGKINGIFYFGDLGDTPPLRSELPSDMPKIFYICPEGTYDQGFADRVADYADVIEVSEVEILVTDTEPAPAQEESMG